MGTGNENKMPMQGSVERDTPKGSEGSQPEMEGGGPGGREDRWIGWYPEKHRPKTDIKMAVKQEKAWMGKTREDR